MPQKTGHKHTAEREGCIRVCHIIENTIITEYNLDIPLEADSYLGQHRFLFILFNYIVVLVIGDKDTTLFPNHKVFATFSAKSDGV